jgi:hypothetical protein
MKYVVLFCLMLLMMSITTTVEGNRNKKHKKKKHKGKGKKGVARTSEDCNIQYNTSTNIPEAERLRDHHNCIKSM